MRTSICDATLLRRAEAIEQLVGPISQSASSSFFSFQIQSAFGGGFKQIRNAQLA
jgi:hypothetical protein